MAEAAMNLGRFGWLLSEVRGVGNLIID
jgi:hypothetical protein